MFNTVIPPVFASRLDRELFRHAITILDLMLQVASTIVVSRRAYLRLIENTAVLAITTHVPWSPTLFVIEDGHYHGSAPRGTKCQRPCISHSQRVMMC